MAASADSVEVAQVFRDFDPEEETGLNVGRAKDFAAASRPPPRCAVFQTWRLQTTIALAASCTAGLVLGFALGQQRPLPSVSSGAVPPVTGPSASSATTSPPPSATTSLPPSDICSCPPTLHSQELEKLRAMPWNPFLLAPCETAAEAADGAWEDTDWVPFRCNLGALQNDSSLHPDQLARLAGKRLLIYGDSQGTHLANGVAAQLKRGKAIKSQGSPKCPHQSSAQLKKFFDVNDTGIKFDCVECSGCQNVQWKCANGIMLWSVVAEFLNQTSITSAGNPALLQWLFRSLVPQKRFDYVIGNIGVHELTQIENDDNSLKPLAQRFATMIGLLSELVSQGRKPLFILTGDISRKLNLKWGNVTSSYHIRLMNGIMRTMLAEAGLPLVDPFRLSRKGGDQHLLHSDRVHVHKSGGLYYRTLAQIILTTL